MPSLNLDLDILQNPKVKKLRRTKLGPLAEVYVIRLWIHAAKFYVADGVFTNQSAEDLESEADWRGKTGAMVDAMVSTGWLERVGSDFAIHDWSEHQGHLSAYKVRSQKANKSRWDKARQQQSPADEADASSIHDGVLEDDPRNPPSSLSSLSLPSQLSSPSSLAPPTSPANAAAAADDDDFIKTGEKEKSRKKELAAELQAAGIHEPTRSKLANIAGVLPAHVRVLRFEAAANKKLVAKPGWIVDQLRGGALPKTITPQVACALVNAGELIAIGCEKIIPQTSAKWDATGMTADTATGRKKCAPDQLLVSSMKFRAINGEAEHSENGASALNGNLAAIVGTNGDGREAGAR
jgi:hypothetical protein